MGKRWLNPAMDKRPIRRRRTRLLIDRVFQGVDAALASALGVQPSYIARWFTDKAEHRRNIGEDMARRIEAVGGVPDGWLDREDDSDLRAISGAGLMRKLDLDEWQLVQAYRRADGPAKAAIQAFVHQIGRRPPVHK